MMFCKEGIAMEKRTYADAEKERIFIDKIQRQNPFEWEYYLKLVSHEKMSRDELAAYNFKRRVETVRYAYENTIFYRNLYDSVGLKPDDIKSEDDWDAVPEVTKEDVRNHFNEMLVPGTQSIRKVSTTSGSTGYPLTVAADKPYFEAQSVEWRARGWMTGRPLGEPLAGFPILGLDEAILRRTSGIGAITPKVASVLNRLSYPTHRFFFDSPSLSLETMREFMEDVQKQDGGYHLYGYVGTVNEFANAILDGKLELRKPPFTISCGASVMTKTARKRITEAFGVVPYDLLGCNEIGRIAVESHCDLGALTVFSDIRHVDIVDKNGGAIHDSNEGFLLVTNFDTRTMPFVKYRLGDITRFIDGASPSGLPFPRIAQVSGRETDYITDVNNLNVYGPSACFDDYPNAVQRYQWVDHGPGRVTLRCVLNKRNPNAEKEVRSVYNQWTSKLAGRMEISLDIVDAINDVPGKIRFIVHEREING